MTEPLTPVTEAVEPGNFDSINRDRDSPKRKIKQIANVPILNLENTDGDAADNTNNGNSNYIKKHEYLIDKL